MFSDQFRLCNEPVFHIMAVHSAMILIVEVSPIRDFIACWRKGRQRTIQRCGCA